MSHHTQRPCSHQAPSDEPAPRANACSAVSGNRGRGPVQSVWVGRLTLAVLAVHAGLLAFGASIHSPAWDEWGHLPAGIGHWRLGQFDLYRVNPPLVRMVAAVPVLFCAPEIEWPGMAAPHVRPEWPAAWSMVRAHGERVFWWFTLARWACIPFSLLGAWICFRWASDLYGAAAGLTAAVLWCFSPTVLAHGQMITPDVGSAALGAAAGYLFWRWLRDPAVSRACAAGLVLGLAQLTKFTWVILFGLWPLLWLIWRLGGQREDPVAPLGDTGPSGAVPDGYRQRRRREAGHVALMVMLAVYMINLGYGFEGTGTRLGELRFVSRTLRMPRAGDTPAMETRVGNRFAGTFWGWMPIPVPVNYVLGIDRQKYDFEAGFWSYLRGQWQQGGWWYYYLYALAIKEPLGTWLLVLLAAAAGVAVGRGGPATWRDEMLLLAPMLSVLVLVSSQTGFNHHLRYVLPMYPLAFVWISRAARPGVRSAPVYRLLVVAALAWSAGSSLRHYPHSLSYFNELAGGPRHGHDHLLGSNIDWGQDLLNLRRWLARHPQVELASLEHSVPFFDVSLAGIRAPQRQAPSAPEPGWHAISVNRIRERGGRLKYFLRFEPAAMAGYSIYIYHITAEEANRVRAELGLPELERTAEGGSSVSRPADDAGGLRGLGAAESVETAT